MNILSIQSHVAYGHVGNDAAAFPLQRLGIEVWPVHTVQFSNHTGYGAWRGAVFDAAMIAEVVEGIAERGVLPSCDGVLSGYMGSPGIGEAILGAVAKVKAANPKALYCCDPVIGDVGRGVFVRPGVPDFFRDRAIPMADVIAPNHFELDYLTGGETRNLAGAFAAIDALHRRGPKAILVTSLHVDGTPDDAVDLVASGGGGRFRLRTPKLPISVNGAGDAIAALFFAHYLRDGSLPGALGKAASSVFGVLKRTAERGAREILLVEAQEEIVRPGRVFEPEKLA